MLNEIGGVPPLPQDLRCELGPMQFECDDREAALDSVDRRIGELYAVDDRDSVLSMLDELQHCFVGLAIRDDRGKELNRRTHSECETLTIVIKTREMHR